MAKKINYQSRNFLDVKNELNSFIRQYYPDLFTDFNDSSVGSMLIDLNAAVSDMLSHHTDRMYNETQIDFAQERRSLLSIARTFGLKIPGKRPAVTQVDLSVQIPKDGGQPDWSYAPIVRRGSQFVGGGQTFELLDDIDFSSGYEVGGGGPNRTHSPLQNQNEVGTNYIVNKTAIVVAGTTKIYKKVITTQESVPFYELILPDDNVISVEQVIALPGTDFVSNPTLDQFLELDNQYFGVDSLAEDKVFVDDDSRTSDNSAIIPAKWIEAPKRFTKEYTDRGFCKLTFGSGDSNQDILNTFQNTSLPQRLGDFINTMALGEIPQVGTTIFVRYRVGGGTNTNIGNNVLKGIGVVDMLVNGPNETQNRFVRNSLTVNNSYPAFGGADEPSIDMIRNYVKYNFASQNRAVTLKDYLVKIHQMPGQFGVPFRVNLEEEQNKINVYTIGIGNNGKLSNISTNTLKENIATYLSDYRMLNDYVLIKDGNIINLGFEVSVMVEKSFTVTEVVNRVSNETSDFLDINKHEMGENIYLGQLIERINNVPGVLNVIDIRVWNMVGENNDKTYSLNTTLQLPVTNPKPEVCSQGYFTSNPNTTEIDVSEEFTIYGEANSMFEIKYPEIDIKVCVKKAQ